MTDFSVKAISIIALAVLAILFSAASSMDLQDEQLESSQYAEMVCLGRQTGQQYGWPNYRNLDIDCGEVSQ